MARKIMETLYVDHSTGEITKSEKQFITNNSERFIMMRTTDGIDWDLKFNNITELQLLNRMVLLANLNNGHLISLPKYQIEGIANTIGVSVSMINKCLGNLVENDFIKRVERGFYIVNPLYLYRCKSKDVMNKYKEYKGLDKKRYNRKPLKDNELNTLSVQ